MAAVLNPPIYSSAFSLCCLNRLWNCSDVIVSLYCSLNFLFSISNRPSSSLYTSCSACIRVSNNCRPCLPSQFLIINNHSVWLTLKLWRMFFTSSLKSLSSAYLSFALESNLGCFMIGLLILGHTFSSLPVLATDMA